MEMLGTLLIHTFSFQCIRKITIENMHLQQSANRTHPRTRVDVRIGGGAAILPPTHLPTTDLVIIVFLQVATLTLLTLAQPVAAVECTSFTPASCWFKFPKPANEEPFLLPQCSQAACDFEQSALECPFHSSGTYATVDAEYCDLFMRVGGPLNCTPSTRCSASESRAYSTE